MTEQEHRDALYKLLARAADQANTDAQRREAQREVERLRRAWRYPT